MMQWVISTSIRLRALVAAIAALLLIAGAWQLRHVPLDAVPEFSPLSLQVKTEALGLSAAEVESLITVPMEADLLNGVPWLKSIESESMTGLSSIELFFVPGTDLLQARQMVQERLTQAHALPNVSKPPRLLQPVASAGRIMNIGLSSKTVSLIDMSAQAQWTIVPRLAGVPGVSNVSIWGQRDHQLQILVDPKRLHDSNVKLGQVIKTAGEAVWASPLTYLSSSTPGSGGFIDTPNQRINIRHVSPIVTASEFAKIPVHGTTSALGDVANIVKSHQPLIGDAIVKGGPGLILVVEKFPDFNTTEVTRGVEEALQALRPGMTGIEVDTTIYRPSSFLQRAAGNLSTGLIAAGALAIIGFCALLGSLRLAFVGLVSMAVSLMVAALILYARGMNFNLMLVAGLLLAVGIVIDDAVTGAMNIKRRLLGEPGQLGGPALRQSILLAVAQVRGPAFCAMLILAIAVTPILFMTGLSAAFFRPIILAYLIAIVVSMLTAMVVTPALAMLLIPNTPRSRPTRSASVSSVLTAREAFVRLPSRSWAPAAVLVIAGFVALFLAWDQRDRLLIPTFRETDILVEVGAPPGTSLPAMTMATQTLVEELRKIPGINNAAAMIGRGALSHEVADVNTGEVWVSIDAGAPYETTLAAIRRVVNRQKDLSGELQPYLSKVMQERLTGDDESITVRVYGHELSILRAKAEEVRAMLSKVKGVRKPSIEQLTERDAIDVSVDLDRAKTHGLKPGDVRRFASAMLSGITVGALFNDQKVIDVVVWGTPEIRASEDDVSNLLIETDSGGLVKMSDIAVVKTTPVVDIIRRQGVSRRIDIEADVTGRPLNEVYDEVARRLADISFPFEYYARVLGEHVAQRAARNAFYTGLGAALVLILLLLQAVYESWRLALLTFVTLPASILGGILVLVMLRDLSLLGAVLGLFAVLGIAVRNAIMLLRRIQLAERDDCMDRSDAVAQGVRDQFQPILITAITTGLVVLPFVVLGDVAGLEVAH